MRLRITLSVVMSGHLQIFPELTDQSDQWNVHADLFLVSPFVALVRLRRIWQFSLAFRSVTTVQISTQ